MRKDQNMPIIMDSITDADASAAGQLIICGSHGGLYPAYLASVATVGAVIFNDAGIGLEEAGIAGAMALAKVGIPSATVSHNSCRIGDANDMLARGVISSANSLVKNMGISVGEELAAVMDKFIEVSDAAGTLEPISEARQEIQTAGGKPQIFLMDSASLVSPDDEGQIVVTGSHGGLIGADPKRALKAKALLGVFNDAGVGCESAGIARLDALDERGVAALTVSHTSAKIGDANSTYYSGVISNVNATAAKAGYKVDVPLKQAIELLN